MSPTAPEEWRPATAALWGPDPIRASETPMARVRSCAAARAGRDFDDPSGLHAWSVAEPAVFWRPGGVRIGTAGISAEVENIPEVRDAAAIGQGGRNDRLAGRAARSDGKVGQAA